jgi:hypothetical protein
MGPSICHEALLTSGALSVHVLVSRVDVAVTGHLAMNAAVGQRVAFESDLDARLHAMHPCSGTSTSRDDGIGGWQRRS